MATTTTTAEDEVDEGTALASVPGLSRCERCLLIVLARPDSPKLPVAEVARRAGISIASYFRLMRDPDFRATATRLIASMVLRRMSPQVARLVTKAKAGGDEAELSRRQLLDPENRKAIETSNVIAATQTRVALSSSVIHAADAAGIERLEASSPPLGTSIPRDFPPRFCHMLVVNGRPPQWLWASPDVFRMLPDLQQTVATFRERLAMIRRYLKLLFSDTA